MNAPFYIVWSPEERSTPSVRHDSYGSAENEAKRLARFNPGASFYVMKSESVSRKQDVVTELFGMEAIPF